MRGWGIRQELQVIRYAAIERRVLVRDDVGGIGKRGHVRGFRCAGGFGLDPLDHGQSRRI